MGQGRRAPPATELSATSPSPGSGLTDTVASPDPDTDLTLGGQAGQSLNVGCSRPDAAWSSHGDSGGEGLLFPRLRHWGAQGEAGRGRGFTLPDSPQARHFTPSWEGRIPHRHPRETLRNHRAHQGQRAEEPPCPAELAHLSSHLIKFFRLLNFFTSGLFALVCPALLWLLSSSCSPVPQALHGCSV